MYKVMKNYIFISLILLFNINFVFWNSCEYRSQIDQCIDARNNWTSKSIEDFVCVNWNDDKIWYQVILDMEFKKVDKEMDTYLELLENQKNMYFGQWATKNYIDWVNDIYTKWDEFAKKYKDICNISIVQKEASCWVNESTSNQESLAASWINWTLCEKLINTKIWIFNDVAFSILMLNREQISADDKKTYDQWQRSNYDNLLNIMMINLWYIERIWQKWPSKLAHPY